MGKRYFNGSHVFGHVTLSSCGNESIKSIKCITFFGTPSHTQHVMRTLTPGKYAYEEELNTRIIIRLILWTLPVYLTQTMCGKRTVRSPNGTDQPSSRLFLFCQMSVEWTQWPWTFHSASTALLGPTFQDLRPVANFCQTVQTESDWARTACRSQILERKKEENLDDNQKDKSYETVHTCMIFHVKCFLSDHRLLLL